MSYSPAFVWAEDGVGLLYHGMLVGRVICIVAGADPGFHWFAMDAPVPFRYWDTMSEAPLTTMEQAHGELLAYIAAVSSDWEAAR